MFTFPFSYQIFDTRISSTVHIPELPLASEYLSGNTPLTFRISKKKMHFHAIDWFHHWKQTNGKLNLSCGKNNTTYWLKFPELACFKIVNLSDIICFPKDNCTSYTINHLLIDQVIPRIISHKNNLVLHGSSVIINKHAIIFSGPSATGKSSLATFFQKQSHSLLSDDTALLKIDGKLVFSIPGYRGLRLWSDSFTQLTPNYHDCKTMAHYTSKKRLYLPALTHSQSLQCPVNAIIFLKKSIKYKKAPFITPISGHSALINILKNTLPLDITDKQYTKQSFATIAQLIKIKTVDIFELSYPHDYSLLPSVYETILSALNNN